MKTSDVEYPCRIGALLDRGLNICVARKSFFERWQQGPLRVSGRVMWRGKNRGPQPFCWTTRADYVVGRGLLAMANTKRLWSPQAPPRGTAQEPQGVATNRAPSDSLEAMRPLGRCSAILLRAKREPLGRPRHASHGSRSMRPNYTKEAAPCVPMRAILNRLVCDKKSRQCPSRYRGQRETCR